MAEKKKYTPAEIATRRRYMEKTYKKLQVMVKPEEYEFINNYCKNKGISKAQFIVAACRQYVDNVD